MTLGGFALAIGMLVDDATVEVENIHRNRAGQALTWRCSTAPPDRRAAIVSTLSICIVFFPVLLLTGAASTCSPPSRRRGLLDARLVLPLADARADDVAGDPGASPPWPAPPGHRWAPRAVNRRREGPSTPSATYTSPAPARDGAAGVRARLLGGDHRLSILLLAPSGRTSSTVDAGLIRLHVRRRQAHGSRRASDRGRRGGDGPGGDPARDLDSISSNTGCRSSTTWPSSSPQHRPPGHRHADQLHPEHAPTIGYIGSSAASCRASPR